MKRCPCEYILQAVDGAMPIRRDIIVIAAAGPSARRRWPQALTGEYSSAGNVMVRERLGAFLDSHGLLIPEPSEADELLR